MLPPARQGCLDGKTRPCIETQIDSLQHLPPGSDCHAVWRCRIHGSRYRVRVEQKFTAHKVDPFSDRRFARTRTLNPTIRIAAGAALLECNFRISRTKPIFQAHKPVQAKDFMAVDGLPPAPKNWLCLGLLSPEISLRLASRREKWLCSAPAPVRLQNSWKRRPLPSVIYSLGQRILGNCRARAYTEDSRGRMNKYGKFAILMAIIVGALSFLAYSGIQGSTTYYKTITELRQMMGNGAPIPPRPRRRRCAGQFHRSRSRHGQVQPRASRSKKREPDPPCRLRRPRPAARYIPRWRAGAGRWPPRSRRHFPCLGNSGQVRVEICTQAGYGSGPAAAWREAVRGHDIADALQPLGTTPLWKT